MSTTNTSFYVKNGLNVNNGLLFANNGKVGIGNTTPDAVLTVTGTANIQGATVVTTTLASGNLTITGFANATTNVTAPSFYGNVFATTINATSNVITTNVYATNVNANTFGIHTGNVSGSVVNASANVNTGTLYGNVIAGTINATSNVTTVNVYATLVTSNVVATYVNATANVSTPTLYGNVIGTTINATSNVITTNVYATTINASSNVITTNVYATNVNANTYGIHTGNVSGTILAGSANVTAPSLFGNVFATYVNATANVIAPTVYANVVSTYVSATANVTVGSNVLANATTIAVGNSIAYSNMAAGTLNITGLATVGNVTANVANVTTINITGQTQTLANVFIGNAGGVSADLRVFGNLYVTGQTVSTGTTSQSGNFLPATDNIYNLGNSTLTWQTLYVQNVFATAGLYATTVVANLAVGTINATSNGLTANANMLRVGNSSVYVNVVPGAVYTTSNVVTTNVYATLVTANVSAAVINATTSIGVGGNTINTTVWTGSASYLGGVASAGYVNTSGSYTLTGILTFGNSIANATVNSTLLQVSNGTSTANLSPLSLTIGSVVSNSGGFYGLHTGNVTGNTVIASANLNTNSVYATNVYATTVAANVTGILTGNVVATNVATTTMNGNVAAIYVSSTANVSTNSVFATNVNATTTTSNVVAVTVNASSNVITANVYATILNATTLNSNVVAATVSASANVTVGANVFMNTTVVSVGGNTINATTYSGAALTANNASYLGGVISSSYVSTTGNFTVAGTIGFGNSTVNALANSVLFQLSNSTSVANLTPLALTIGSVVSNSSGFYGNVSGTTVVASANLNTNSVYATNVYATTANTSTLYATLGANSIQLTNGTQNWIGWNNNGTAPPTITTSSVGTKLLLYPAVSSTSVDFAIGIASGTLWQSVQGPTHQFQWFANTTAVATLSGLGNYSVTGNITALTFSGNVIATTVNATTVNANVVSSTVSATANVTVGSSVFMNTTVVSVGGNTINATTYSGTALTSNNSSYLNGQLASYYTDIPTRLGYTPLSQGTGTGQSTNGVKIGWSNSVNGGASLRLMIDSTDFANTWPISISGLAATATTANSTTYFGGAYTWAAPAALGATTANTGKFTTLTTTGNTSLAANIVITSTAGISANGSYGTANQVLTSNGSAVYWGTGASLSQTYTAVTGAGTTAVKFNRYHLDSTAGAFTITLPSSATAGDWVQFIDAGQVAGSNNITVAPNSLNIENSTASLVININRAAFYLVYNSTYGWVLA